MRIEPADSVGSHKQHSLDPNLSAVEIAAALPGVRWTGPHDGKVEQQWDFLADGVPCSIWDYQGARWSAYGPREVFEKLGLRVVGNGW